MQIIERTRERYEVQKVEFGRVYRWCPECVVVECDCGEKSILTASTSTCAGCGADHATVVRGESAAGRLESEALHPWRYAKDSRDAGLPY